MECEIQAYKVAMKMNDFRAAREAGTALLNHVTGTADKAQAHFLIGKACYVDGISSSHEKPFEAADSEFRAALELAPGKLQDCLFLDGQALAHLKRDGEARERFQQYAKMASPTDVNYERAQRFAEHPELARGRMAPNFRMTTLDGQTVTLEDLTGKVVLIDFWATWCGPCREALPKVRSIAQKFAGQPFVVVSVSLDKDDAKWKEFVGKNGMSWMQYRDGSDGAVARMFGVHAIPATFTIDPDGILQDQRVGDLEIEGKIKKLLARTAEMNKRKAPVNSASTSGAH